MCVCKQDRMVDQLNERDIGSQREKSELKSSLNLKAIKILFAMIIAADQCLIKRSNCLSNSLILCGYIFSLSSFLSCSIFTHYIFLRL